jgi:hypothetical protein
MLHHVVQYTMLQLEMHTKLYEARDSHRSLSSGGGNAIWVPQLHASSREQEYALPSRGEDAEFKVKASRFFASSY